jgi:hypothetical protein
MRCKMSALSELLREVVCGDVDVPGAKVQIPNNRFSAVISKIRGIDTNEWRWSYYFFSFLAKRCSSDFLAAWFAVCQADFEKIVSSYRVWDHNFCLILARLHRLGCLPENNRQAYLAEAIKAALDTGESTFLSEAVRDIMTLEEYESALSRIKNEFIPSLEDIIDDLASDYSDPNEDPSDYFDEFRSNLTSLHDFFEDRDTIKALEDADSLIDDAIFRLEEENREREEEKKRKEQEKEEEEAAKYMDDEAFEALVDEYEHEQTNRRTNTDTQKPEKPSQAQFQKPVTPRNIFDDVDQ